MLFASITLLSLVLLVLLVLLLSLMTPFWTFILILAIVIVVGWILYRYYPAIAAIPDKELIVFVILVLIGAIVAACHMMPERKPMDKYRQEYVGVTIPDFGCG